MIGRKFFIGLPLTIVVLLVAVACAASTSEPTVVEKEVVREVEVPVVVEKEVVKEVEVERVVEVEKIVEVEKEVVVEKIIVVTPEPVDDPYETSSTFKTYKYTGASPTSYSEAPTFRLMAENGQLPTVENRLPENPLVFHPPTEIGQYGGILRFIGESPGGGAFANETGHDGLVMLPIDGGAPDPYVAESWKIENNGAKWTFNLRKGTKYSDGAPFTSEDYDFGYNDIFMNTDFFPGGPYPHLKNDGETPIMSTPDDNTVVYEWTKPYYYFAESLTSYFGFGGYSGWNWNYNAKHYFSQFHPKYGDQAQIDEWIDDAGFENWVQLYRSKATWREDPDVPVIGPWNSVTRGKPDIMRFNAQPYFWSVDPAGNQLPYLNGMVGQIVTDHELLNLKAMAGEADFQYRHIDATKIALYQKNSEKAGFRLVMWGAPHGNNGVISFNQTYDADPEVAKYLRNFDFRKAMSFAIDRAEINTAVFSDLGNPRGAVVSSWTAYYPGDEYAQKYSTFDPEQTNALLDSVGLDEKDSDGFRIDPATGKALEITLFSSPAGLINGPAIGELVVNHWRDVGILTNLKVQSYPEDRNDAMTWLYVLGNFNSDPFSGQLAFAPSQWGFMGPRFSEFVTSGGESGVDPSTIAGAEGFAQVADLYAAGRATTYENRLPMGIEMQKIFVDNLYQIGTVGEDPFFKGLIIVNKNLVNVPDTMSFQTAIMPQIFSYKR